MKRWLVCLFSVVSSYSLLSQDYPKDYFRSPLDTTLYVSANFGAVRGNHFHSGLDIKTFGIEGLNVCAVAEGYVSRIKVSPYGYGKALYIDHPNGYTSVYAHLQGFNDEISQYVEKQQYEKKTFDIELFPGRNKMMVSKGQVIALSGNSGGSTGPHLHFEIRHTKSEEIIDPLLFGIEVNDIGPPKFSPSFLIYEKNDEYKHHYGYYPYVEIRRRVIQNAWDDTVKVKPGAYSFAAWGDDYINPESNEVGINYLQLFDNGNKIFDCGIKRFAFDETRMVNSHIEYNEYVSHYSKWHKCYVEDGNKLDFYNKLEKTFVHITAGEARPITIRTYDLAGFSDSITFILAGDSTQPNFRDFEEAQGKELVYPGTTYSFKEKTYSFTIPAGALYDTAVAVSKLTAASRRKDLYAGYVSIMKTSFPLQRSYTISIKTNTLPSFINPEKLVVVRLSGKGLRYKSSEGGTYKNGWITATSRNFGVFSVAYDNAPPTVDRYRQNDSVISVRINDNLSGIDSYNAYIDGNWWLMEYDAKADVLWGFLPKDLASGKHEFKVVVTDERKNTTTFDKAFVKP